jgi:hypothetical protein
VADSKIENEMHEKVKVQFKFGTKMKKLNFQNKVVYLCFYFSFFFFFLKEDSEERKSKFNFN